MAQKKIKIFIASSSELKNEREATLEICNTINKLYEHLTLEPIKWETDIPSGSYDKKRIQDEINPLVLKSDILIVMFYSFIGAFTKEEYDFALSKDKKVFIYFKKGFSPNNKKGIRSLNKVISFKDEIIKENTTLFQEFDKIEDFKLKVQNDLQLYLNEKYPEPIELLLTNKFLNLTPSISLSEVIGRERELGEVKTKLETDNSLVLVNGIGGVGKTTLAKAFMQRYMEKYNHIAWIDVSPSLIEAVIADNVLIENLQLKEKVKEYIEAKQPDDAYKLILNKLCGIDGINLIALDNAETKDGKEITELKSLAASNWKILITSREHIAGCNEYPLDVLSPEKAKELFLTCYKHPADENDLDDLLKYIGYHTLTVELLAKTAELNPLLTVKQVTEYLKTKNLDNKKLVIEIESQHAGNKHIEVYLHLMSAFDLTKLNIEEQLMLSRFSVLPAKEIEFEMLCRLFQVTEENENDFINLLNSLTTKGYLTKNKDSYKIHPIIQEIVKYKLKRPLTDFEVIIESVGSLLYVDQAKDNPVDKFPFLDFGTTLLRNIEVITNIEESDTNIIESLNYLLTVIGLLYQALGRYEEASELLEKALKSDIKNFGENHPTVATSQSNLALVYQALGKYEEAILLLEKSYKTFLSVFGINHPSTKTVKNNLAFVQEAMEKNKI